MIDLHCHMLPGIDDGPRELVMALEMARIAAEDGVRVVACTPHIYPGMYDNDAQGIQSAVASLQAQLLATGIGLELVSGADVHLVPGLATQVAEGRVPTLGGSRYLLLEPPHHVAPPNFEQAIFDLMAAGITPVLTHPERLSWVESHYELFCRLAGRGCWLQVTAGALTDRFGPRVRYWADRFVSEGWAHLIATDAHDTRRRPPLLSEGRAAAAKLVGEEAAGRMVEQYPVAILANLEISIEGIGDGAVASSPSGGLGRLQGWLTRRVRRHNPQLA
ncbi:MAG: capsular biosynthesis protein [Chloroflexota bacterium]|nr:capsular biosynthesis protein [Chloroflexota bacterium]